MKKGSVIQLFIIILVLIAFSACQTRYGHLKKVRKNDKSIVQKKQTPRPKIVFPTLSQKPVPAIGTHLQYGEVRRHNPIAQPIAKTYVLPSLPFNKNGITHTSVAPVDTIIKPPPAIDDIKLGRSNYKEILYLSIILLGILIIYIFAWLGISVVVSLLLGKSIGILVIDKTVAILALVGAILLPPTYLITRYVNRLRKRAKVTYGGVEYTVGEIENMSASVRARRNRNNIGAWFILLLPAIVIFLIPVFDVLIFGYSIALFYLIFKAIWLHFKKRREAQKAGE